MKTIAFIFFAATAFAQTPKLTLCSGAGINPRHIESIGDEAGWVEVWVGPMATGEQLFKIYPEQWGDIETINVVIYGFMNIQHGVVYPIQGAKKREQCFGVSTEPKNYGFWIRLEYQFKFKKA